MAYSVGYIQSSRCMLLTFSGAITTIDILDAMQDMSLYIKRGKYFTSIISDYSGVTEFNVFADGVMKIAESTTNFSTQLPNICVAVVAPNAVIFGSSRMWEVFSSEANWEKNTFKTRKEAETWLCGKLGRQTE